MNKVLGGIYKIATNVNDHIYIGSSKNLKRRFREHFRELERGKHKNSKLQNHVNKYGIGVLTIEIIEEVFEVEFLIEREQVYLDSFNPFFNTCIIADRPLGIKQSDETKRKVSLAVKGRVFSEQHKARISESLKGKRKSEEWCANISKSKRGKTQSLQIIANRVTKNTGKTRTQEVRVGMSEKMKGIKKSEIGKQNMKGAKARHREHNEWMKALYYISLN